jgi:hypothetical protein
METCEVKKIAMNGWLPLADAKNRPSRRPGSRRPAGDSGALIRRRTSD